MGRLLFIFLFVGISGALWSQSQDEIEIRKTIERLFDGMRASDSTSVRTCFLDGATMGRVTHDDDGKTLRQSRSVDGFVEAIGRPKKDVWDERIWSYDINVDKPLATAWTEYSFYLNKDLSHCGVNIFEFVHTDNGWKISSIIDTRRKEGCKEVSEYQIGALINAWHKAAAEADEDTFFGLMTPDAIYIGTDATERWYRDDMREWSKEFFDRESAWAFTPKSRNISISSDGETAWFDEILDTWMGTCRGSGVMAKTADGWKIAHYHLAIAVPNEKVDGYLKLIGKTNK